MKSILQEAPSVSKAIEKAWDQAGRPQDFTIKILEEGEKRFLGLTGGKPAVISITYQPVKDKRPKIDFEKNLTQKDKKPFQHFGGTPQKQSRGIIGSFFGEKPKETVIIKKEPIQKKQPTEKNNIWGKDLVDNVNIWLKEMMHIMGVDVTIDFKHDQRILNVFIDKRVFKDSEEEKLFFISISHLLMQFLKRKYKRKFANYYLIIHSKVAEYDNKKSMPSNK
jgi:predicted RNA-binding protein Jag